MLKIVLISRLTWAFLFKQPLSRYNVGLRNHENSYFSQTKPQEQRRTAVPSCPEARPRSRDYWLYGMLLQRWKKEPANFLPRQGIVALWCHNPPHFDRQPVIRQCYYSPIWSNEHYYNYQFTGLHPGSRQTAQYAATVSI